MEDPVCIWKYCVHGLDLPAGDDFHLRLFVNTIGDIALDMNWFNKDKHPCAICGQKGHSFDGSPQLKNSNVEQAYISLLLVNCFMCGVKKLDPSGQNQDFQTVQGLTLSELDSIEHVELFSLSLSSSILFLPFS